MKDLIQFQAEPLTKEDIKEFSSSTLSNHSLFPLTFPTRYRNGEFELLIELKIDMRNLLHTEQEYVYHEPFKLGDVPLVTTRLKEHKERRRMQFVTAETEVICGGRKKITAVSSFVIREKTTKESV
ncbi:MAG: hypothetical protein EB078_05135 [Proteobacteria bacterium]|nr:hypothetical protein [Pseudomonadota bacterium]NDC25944.1 hypothetical protein [Pseudomonadota bacterium]NDD04269.1 hypothetical protein [Pseudomonadota bacterium]NDG26793.1 hypothetical protein [Pseudomonadota bacterium]